MARLPGFDPAWCEQVYNVVRTIARRRGIPPLPRRKPKQGRKEGNTSSCATSTLWLLTHLPRLYQMGAATNQGRRSWRGCLQKGGGAERHWAQVPERDRAREFGTSDGPLNRRSPYWIGCSSQSPVEQECLRSADFNCFASVRAAVLAA